MGDNSRQLLSNLVMVLKSGDPLPGQQKPISSQRELIEDMLKVYEIAHPGIFEKARNIETIE